MIFILVTCADAAQAEIMAEALIERRLAACVQIMPPHKSVYRWQGKVEHSAEVNLLIKTQDGLFEDVRTAVVGLHSYEVPLIASWSAEQVHAPYLEWLAAQTIQ